VRVLVSQVGFELQAQDRSCGSSKWIRNLRSLFKSSKELEFWLWPGLRHRPMTKDGDNSLYATIAWIKEGLTAAMNRDNS
jgi:hypothetical protein